MSLDEVTEKPGFWILGVVGTICVIFGWVASKRMGMTPMPLWQVIVTIIVIWIASVIFAARG